MVASSSSNEKEVHEVHIPEELRQAGGWSAEELEGGVQFLVAVKLFELRKVSVGRAAELCGMRLLDFIDKLKGIGVPWVVYDDEDLLAELRSIR